MTECCTLSCCSWRSPCSNGHLRACVCPTFAQALTLTAGCLGRRRSSLSLLPMPDAESLCSVVVCVALQGGSAASSAWLGVPSLFRGPPIALQGASATGGAGLLLSQRLILSLYECLRSAMHCRVQHALVTHRLIQDFGGQAGLLTPCCRVPWQQVEQAIIRLDPAVFQSLEDVDTVLQCVPTEDEQKLLQSYVQSGGRAEALSTAELFCLDLMKVSAERLI